MTMVRFSPNEKIENEYDFHATPKLRKEVDTTDGSVIYQGWAVLKSTTSSPVWRVKRTTISGSLITDEWALGSTEFANVWDDRASLSYS